MRSPHLDGFGDPVVVGGDVVKSGGTLASPMAEHARELMHESRANLRARARSPEA